MKQKTNVKGVLAAGGIAAILASTCCLGPLVLLALGIGGAWVALYFAYRRIYRPAAACEPGEVCAIPQVRTTYKLIFWIVAVLVLVALGFPYVMPFFY